jgi:uncharacterized protein
MKIAVISDSHDNLPNLSKAVNWIRREKIKLIIHCGDVSKYDFLKEALGSFKGRFFLAKGNCDIEDFTGIPKSKIFDSFGMVKIGGRKIAFTHFPKTADELAKENKYDVVFYGHDHKPWVKKTGRTRVANPGNLAGVFYKSTFAVYDTKTGKLSLEILERIK